MMKTATYNTKSIKAYLREELKEYLRTIGEITVEEKRELQKWVASGKSVNDNPYLLYDESGYLFDFIRGCRIGIDMCENPSYYS